MRGLWALVAAALVGASASADRDSYLADPVQGEWLGKADILFIGDSESLGYFGDNLYRAMAARKDPHSGEPLKVWSYWTCGSDVFSWLRRARTLCGIRTCNTSGHCARDSRPGEDPASVTYGPLKTYLEAVKPRVTVLSLGTNFLSAREFSAATPFYLERATALLRTVKKSGSRCIWIGPPQAALKTRSEAEYGVFVAGLKKTVESSGCAFIDSAPLSDRRYVMAGDPEGTHYQGEGEKKWAAAVWTVLAPALDKLL